MDQDATYVELPSDLGPLINAADNGGVHLPAGDPTVTPGTYVDPVKKMSGATTISNVNNYQFVFNANGTITVTNLDKYTWMTGTSAQAVTWRNSFSPALTTTPNGGTAGANAQFSVTIANTNGAVVVDQGNIFVSGRVNGRVTIAALANDNSSALIAPFSNERSDGNVIVNGNIIYNTHPTGSGAGYTSGYWTADNRDFDPATVTDALGLIGERNFALDGSCPSGCLVDAHIMMTGQASPNPDVRTWPTTTNTSTVITQAINQDGAFYIEDGNQRDLSELWSGVVDGESGTGASTGSGYKGTNNNLYLTGGVVHFVRGQTANGTGGYTRKYAYDTRLSTNPPPFYPLTPSISIIGWNDTSSTTDPS